MMDNVSEQLVTQATANDYAALGNLLKTAREQLGWRAEDVAEKLYIEKSVVRTIESGQYDASQLTTFMRGYIRNYAKLVKIPEDDINAVLKQLGIVKEIPKQVEPIQMDKTRHLSLKDKPVKLVTYIIVAILIVFILSFWHSHRAINNVAIAPDAQEAQSQNVNTDENVVPASSHPSASRPVDHDAISINDN